MEPAKKEASKTHILVDETIFIYATRRNDHLGVLSNLAIFFGQSEPSKKDSKYALHLSNVSAYRLGMFPVYNFIRKYFCWKKERKVMYAKRRERKIFAKASISRYKFLFLGFKFFHIKPHSWELMDLHLFANEAKRAELNRPMEINEVISMDTCKIAKIAHDNKLPILSFNTDFKYFSILPNLKKPYLEHFEAVDFLRKVRPI